METVFDNAVFIKPDVSFKREFSLKDYAPMFRKKVVLEKTENAKLYVCGLGYGYYYINGNAVSEDLFTAPVSDYRKTLWYNTYDVSHLLKKGENTFAVVCGNGWYNESFDTVWETNLSQLRDLPKFIMRLEIDGETVLVSDTGWKCKSDGPIFYNQLRSGEFFDANLYEENWKNSDYDDSKWERPAKDKTPPMGVFRECLCEPIREFDVYEPVMVKKTGDKKYVFDMGQNIAGYIRLTVTGNKGDVLTIRHTEDINDDFSLQINDLADNYQKDVPIQTDKFICSGKEITWSPKFTYHGFRYVEIDGITDIETTTVKSVFVHQAVKQKTEFECSNEVLNKLFQAGVMSCYSNMYYLIADCPTREKLGWMNDIQSSAEQFFVTFDVKKLFEKYMQDIFDSMLTDGSLPSIVPTPGWGYDWIVPMPELGELWGDGPVCDGAMFEIPYRIYLHSGDSSMLVASLPYFKKYLRYLRGRKTSDGFNRFGLPDWATPGNKELIGCRFVNAVLEYSFYQTTCLAASVAGDEDAGYYARLAEEQKEFVIKTYINSDGRCTINEQISVGMLIYHDLYNDLDPLKAQLCKLLEDADFHHNCGMVGLRRLYYALDKCGLSDYAYKIITVEGYPGYKAWLDNGATTLWEYWEPEDHTYSKNHHMYSDFMSWLVKNLAGINIDETRPGECEYILNPKYIDDISYVKCRSGEIEVNWSREDNKVVLSVVVGKNAKLSYKGKKLSEGRHTFEI